MEEKKPKVTTQKTAPKKKVMRGKKEVETKELSREELNKKFQKRYSELKQNLINRIEDIDIDNSNYKIRKQNINFLYKINRGINTASFSDEKEVGNVILSSEKTKDFVEYAEKIDGILAYYNKEIETLAQKGLYSELSEYMTNASDFVENIEKSLVSLQNDINSAFEKGIGNRRDLDDFRKAKRKESIVKAAELLQTGELPSVVKDKLETTDEIVSTALNGVRDEYIQMHKAEIIEKLNKKIAFEEIAEQMEIKPDHIKEVYNEVLPAFFESNKADILKMIKEGLEHKEIAKALNIKSSVSFPYMDDIFISILTTNKTKIVKQVLDGKEFADIAKSYNVPEKVLKKQVLEWEKTNAKLQMLSTDKVKVAKKAKEKIDAKEKKPIEKVEEK